MYHYLIFVSRVETLCIVLKDELTKRFLYGEDLVDNDDYFPIDYLAALLDVRTRTLPFVSIRTFQWCERRLVALLSETMDTQPLPDDVPDSIQEEDEDLAIWGDCNSRLGEYKESEQPYQNPAEAEVKEYMKNSPNPKTLSSQNSFEILKWWKRNEINYPNLARLARVRFCPYMLAFYCD